jgi:GNAT superfamily N-acetyltransferase
MSDIAYTLANENHIQILIDFRIKFLIEFGGPQPQELQDSLSKELQIFFENNLNKNYFCWFASIDSEVAGIGAMSMRYHPGNFKNPSGKMAYIMNMYTDPKFRKRGISAAILNKLQETAHEMDVHLFELHATQQGEPEYVKNGFIKHEEPTYRKWMG